MFRVDVYLRVRRAVMVEGMSIREAYTYSPPVAVILRAQIRLSKSSQVSTSPAFGVVNDHVAHGLGR